MRSLLLASMLLCTSCGARTELHHAPDNPDEGVGAPFPQDGALSCERGRKAVLVEGRGVCTPAPRVLRLVDFSLAGFSLAGSNEACAAILGFIGDFTREFLGGVSLGAKSCVRSPGPAREYHVRFTLLRGGQPFSYAFVAGFRKEPPGDLVEAPFLRVCRDTTAVESCREAFVPGAVPSDVARLFPGPSESLVHFHPTLLSFLNQ